MALDAETITGSKTNAYPKCITYFDKNDTACWRCKRKQECMNLAANYRTVCFGQSFDADKIECALCLSRDECKTQKGVNEMAVIKQPGHINILKPKVSLPKREPTEEEVATSLGITDDVVVAHEYFKHPVSELQEGLSSLSLPTEGGKLELTRRLLIYVKLNEGKEEEAAPEPEPAPPALVVKPEEQATPKPPKASKARVKVLATVDSTPAAAPTEPATEAQAPQPPKKRGRRPGGETKAITFAMGDWDKVMAAVPEGKQLRVWCSKGDTPEETVWFIQTVGTNSHVSQKAMLNPAYVKFMNEDAGDGKGWLAHNEEEKIALAKTIGATWEAHASPKVNAIRISGAVQKALGLEKFKPEFQSRSARAAAKAK